MQQGRDGGRRRCGRGCWWRAVFRRALCGRAHRPVAADGGRRASSPSVRPSPVFTLCCAVSRQAGGRSYASTRLNELPVSQFVALFDEPGAIADLAQPEHSPRTSADAARQSLRRIRRAYRQEDRAHDQEGQKGGEVFNPVVLKRTFRDAQAVHELRGISLLRQRARRIHGLHSRRSRAMKEFTGDECRNEDPREHRRRLRRSARRAPACAAMDGMATGRYHQRRRDDIHDAAKMTWFDDPLHGLVV